MTRHLRLALLTIALLGISSRSRAQNPIPAEDRDGLPGAMVGPSRAEIEELIRSIDRDPVSPDLVDRIDSLYRPRWASQRVFSDLKKKLADNSYVTKVDAIAVELTGKKASTRALLFRATSVEGDTPDALRESFRDDRDREEGTWKTISGQVREEGLGGRPIKGAVISGISGVMARTDDRGRYTLKARSPKGGLPMVLNVEAPGFALTQTSFPWGELPDSETVDFRLPNAVSFGGRVLDEQGKPIAGADLDLGMNPEAIVRDGSGRRAGFVGVSSFKARTDGEGKYAFRNVPPELPDRQSAMSLTITHARFLPRQKVYAANEMLGPGWEITMEQGCVISGVVLDEDKKPFAGVSVQATFNPAFTVYPTVITDAEGRFRFENIPPGAVNLIVRPEAYLATTAAATASKDKPADLKIAANRGQFLTGKVVDADGKPVKNAMVGWLRPLKAPAVAVGIGGMGGGGVSPAYNFSQSKEDGTFRAGPVEKGTYEVTVLSEQPRLTGKAQGEAGGPAITITVKPAPAPDVEQPNLIRIR